MKIAIIAMVVLLLGAISAEGIDIIAGENHTFTLSEPYDYYTISGIDNSSGIEISQNNTEVTIGIGKHISSGNISITFYNEEHEAINVYRESSGGGGRKQNKVQNNPPAEAEQEDNETNPAAEANTNTNSGITGAIIGSAAGRVSIIILIVFVLVLGAILLIRKISKKSEAMVPLA